MQPQNAIKQIRAFSTDKQKALNIHKSTSNLTQKRYRNISVITQTKDCKTTVTTAYINHILQWTA